MVSDLPTGVVTLLFTDVEGSTRLLHELGDDYGEALHEHRRRLRAAFAEHEGVEVDTQGDAFFVAFARASNAVAAAADGQRALAEGPIRVRMGLHTGEPRLTEEGYVGLDVHKGARIAAVGHGGQVLLSQTTRALVDADVRDLGVHRLKDLSAPERIYQLEIDGLPCDFPLLKTIEAGMKNLPAPRTSFVGRAVGARSEIDRLLDDPDCRLLTLVGPGGAGKTRLALEAAAAASTATRTVSTSSRSSPSPRPTSSRPRSPSRSSSRSTALHSGFSAQDQLLDYLGERSTLARARQLRASRRRLRACSSEIIERAPKVELLTTSRERLNVQSEWVFDVEGLGLAENGNGSASAVRLFVERATQVEPGFALDDAGYSQALRICRLVDGMPLGIELAASWVSVLSCAEIADEIEGNIDFLATSMRDVPERHRSLRAVIDQSWRLLTDEQRSAFSRLSVFRGSFDRSAAVAVTGADLRLLSELVSKSLLRRPDFGRFELHELLRQYAAEQLAASSRPRRRTPASGTRVTTRRCSWSGRRHSWARSSRSRGTSCAASWTTCAPRPSGSWPRTTSTRRWRCSKPSTRSSACTAGSKGARRSSGSAHGRLRRRRPRKRERRRAGGGDVPDRHRRPTRVRPGGRGARHCAACPSCARGTWSESSHAACARSASWRVYRDVYPEAVAFLEEGTEIARATGDRLTESGALMDLGFARLLMDDLDAAREAFEAAHVL